MFIDAIVRFWKNPQMRAGLSKDQLASMLPHPSGEGLGELTRFDLRGGKAPFDAGTGWICTLTDDCPNSVVVCC